MASSDLNINGNMAGSGGTLPVSITITFAAPLGLRYSYTLASGFNSIAVPTGATGAILQFPAGNATTITLKGITGDTGLALNPAGVNLVQLTSGQTTIGLTAGGAISSPTYITWL